MQELNKNDDFSYKEKDMMKELMDSLNSNFKDFILFETKNRKASINQVRVYGEAFLSSTKAPKYKCQTHCSIIFSIRIEFMWYAREFLGESTLGSASGKIRITEIDNENFLSASAWENTVKLDLETVPGMMQQPGHAGIPEISELEAMLKQQVTDQVSPVVIPRLKEFLRMAFQENQPLGNIQIDNQSSQNIKNNKSPATEDTPEVAALRRKILGKEYLRIIDSETPNQERVWHFRLCTLRDDNMKELTEKMVVNSALEELDLYFNNISDMGLSILVESLSQMKHLKALDLRHNEIGDGGIQKLFGVLAMGAAPELSKLDLRENPGIGSLSKTMLSGLSMIRKDIQVLLDQ